VVGELIRQQVAQHGDRVLAVLGERRLTYADADRQSAALAKGLLAVGVGKGTRLGLLVPNGPDWIVTWLAASRIGAVVVLLNTYAPPRELDWLLRHSDVALLVTADTYLGRDYRERIALAVEGVREQHHEQIRVRSHPYLRAVWVLGGTDGDRPRDAWWGRVDDLVKRGVEVQDVLLRAAEDQVSPADPVVIVYSSGSTADPKGAIHTHGALVRHGLNLSRYRPLRADDRVYTTMPFFWVGGLSYALVRAMHAGAALVCEERFEPGATLELLERQRVTHVVGWPHVGTALAAHPDFTRRDLSSIRSGPAELLPDSARVRDPGLVATSLGMTETLGPHLIDEEGRELQESKRGSFGRALPGLEHRVVDDQGRDVSPGQPGELWVRGYSVMAGLHKHERDEVFTADGWYPTGDGGWLDEDGHFYFTGRLGDLIKAKGMNVSPREVEQALEEQPDVVRAVVVGIPAGDRGEDVAAAVVARPAEAGHESPVTADELVSRLRDILAAYKLPRQVAVFTDEAQLPKLDSGKIDRRSLAELLTKWFASG
jgi:acyl-CoA synthetase (AMP-forming)/AMP-acid ligase II